MAESTHQQLDSVLHWPDPALLSDFVDELRLAGYNIGLDQYIAAHDLMLLLLAQRGNLDDPHALGPMLGPLLCTSPSEQVDFQHRFADWAARVAHTIRPPEIKSQRLADLDKELADIEISRARWRLGFTLVAILIGLSLIGLSSYYFFAAPRILPTPSLPIATPAVGEPVQPSPDAVTINWIDRIVEYLPVWRTWLVVGLLLLILLVLARHLWWCYRAHLFLMRRTSSEEPEIQHISVRSVVDALFPAISFFRIAQGLRRRITVPARNLSIRGTLRRTVARGGWFTPVYGTRQMAPEYLILIDRRTFRDHQAHFVDELVRLLRANEVYITLFYFDDDPRICLPAHGDEAPVTLAELNARYVDHRLLLFADAATLFHPLTGQVASWADQLTVWADRVLLTPEPVANWGYHERALADHLAVLPATPMGLDALIQQMQRGRAAAPSDDDGPVHLPVELRTRPLRWIENQPLEPSLIDKTLTELRRYLGLEGFSWLAACAVYPEINWNLTLYLGDALREDDRPLLNPQRLLALARLPWFRYGYMPDWLRSKLLATQTPDQESRVRRALQILLAAATLDAPGEDALTIARLHNSTLARLAIPLMRLLARRVEEDSPLRDQVFMDFMTGHKPLAFQLPQPLVNLLTGRRLSLDWALIGWWSLANIIGVVLGLVVAIWDPFAFYSNASADSDFFWVYAYWGLLFGAAMGGSQWLLALRRRGVNVQWIWATIVGNVVGLLNFAGVLSGVSNLVAETTLTVVMVYLFVGILHGFAVGAAQWVVLRRSAARAVRWVYVNVVGYMILWGAVGLLVDSNSIIGEITVLVAGALLYCLITGITLSSLLTNPKTSTSSAWSELTTLFDRLPRLVQWSALIIASGWSEFTSLFERLSKRFESARTSSILVSRFDRLPRLVQWSALVIAIAFVIFAPLLSIPMIGGGLLVEWILKRSQAKAALQQDATTKAAVGQPATLAAEGLPEPQAVATEERPPVAAESDAQAVLRQSRPARLLPALPGATLIVLLSLVPILMTFYLSLREYNILRPGTFVGLANYTQLFSDALFWPALGFTAAICAVRVSAVFVVWLMMTLALRQERMIPRWLVLTGLAPLLFLSPSVTPVLWRTLLTTTFQSLISPTPIGYRLYLLLIDGMTTLAVAAGVGLAICALIQNGRRQTAAPVLATIRDIMLLVALASGLQSFDWSYSITDGGLNNSTQTLMIALYRQQFMFFQVGYGAVYGVLMLLPLLAVAILLWRRRTRLRLISITERVTPDRVNTSFVLLSNAGPLVIAWGLLPALLVLLPHMLLWTNWGVTISLADALAAAPWTTWFGNTVTSSVLPVLIQIALSIPLARYLVGVWEARAVVRLMVWLLIVAAVVGIGPISAALYLYQLNLGLLDTLIGVAIPVLSSAFTVLILIALLSGGSEFGSNPVAQGETMTVSRASAIPFSFLLLLSVLAMWWASQRIFWPLLVLNSVNNFTIGLGLVSSVNANTTAPTNVASFYLALLPFALPASIVLVWLGMRILPSYALVGQYDRAEPNDGAKTVFA